MVIWNLLATAIAAVILLVDTLIMASFGILVGPIPPRGNWTLRGARWWARIIIAGAFVRLRCEDRERVPRDTPVVFMANHESWIDIPALLSAVPVQVRFLAKKSLFRVPFLGWAMSAMTFIPVDRTNRREAIRSFEEAGQRICTGRSVLLFPEETRAPSRELLPFQRGGFLIAIKAGVPIVPIGLEGAGRCLPKHSYLLRPGTVTVRFGAPIPTIGRGVTDKDELMAEVRAAIETLRGNLPVGGAVDRAGAKSAESEVHGE
ncbi:MAG: 1-acyl-sn-glycerol-3-phosphate acyltransferase [Acidobacteria bacterium]|nr:1-acyl-sn-glycerol-3-phosphate acyltransferase [Acidobacteriota bacterium]